MRLGRQFRNKNNEIKTSSDNIGKKYTLKYSKRKKLRRLDSRVLC